MSVNDMYPKLSIVFKIENNNPREPLCCRLSQSCAKLLDLSDNDLESKVKFVTVLTRTKYRNPNEIGLFVTAKTSSDVCPSVKKQHYSLIGFVSETFLRHYGLSEKDKYYIQKAKCLPLKKIVFGAKTEAAYEWIQSKRWSETLVKSVEVEPVLCRRGDSLLLNPELFPDVDPTLLLDIMIMDCSSVSQGLLTLNTQILVLRITWQTPSTQEIISPTLHHMLSLMNQMSFTSRLLLPSEGDRGSTPDRSTLISGAIMRAVNKKFKINILTKPICDTNRQDVHSTVFLSQQVLMSLKLEEGSWAHVRLTRQRIQRDSWGSDPTEVNSGTSTPVRQTFRQMSIPSGEDDSSSKYEDCLVRVCAHREQDHATHITPLLWFNLNFQPSPLEQPNRQLVLEQLMVSPPPYAEEVYVCLVQTPFYEISINCETLLKQYFSLARCLKKGDIIALPTSGHAATHNQNWKDCLVYPVVYFQVSSIHGPPSTHYLVDTAVSRLYQSGANQSYLPVTMETYGSSWSMHPVWESPRPPGLEVHVDRLCQLITPFLQNREFRGQVSSCILVHGQTGTGKSLLVKAVSRCLNIQIFVVESQDLVGESAAATESRFKNVASKALTYAPCILLLKDVCSVSKEKEAIGEDPRIVHSLCGMIRSLGSSERSYPVVTVATSTLELSADLQGVFLHQINLEPPDLDNRELILQALLSPLQTGMDLSLEYFAQRTAGMVLGDLSMLVSLASQAAFSRLKTEISVEGLTGEDEAIAVGLSGVPIIHSDMATALEQMHQAHAEAIGAPQIPDVRWEDIGGLEEARKELLDTVQLPLLHPSLTQAGLRRSGVLLYGPPGTGKTLLAKAVATECSLSFLSVKGPELINRYVGQSEENIREVFQRARSASPCIIFFDELDSLGPNRGRSGDSGGVMDRVVSQLLAELDGLHKSNQVFVIGATNRPDLLDPALLRPGRFDRLVEVGQAKTAKGRLGILKALTRKFHLNQDVDLSRIESLCPKAMSGADFYGLCAEANMASLGRCIGLIEEGSLSESAAKPEVTMDDFLSALRTVRTEENQHQVERKAKESGREIKKNRRKNNRSD